MVSPSLPRSILVLFLFFLIFAGLYFAKAFLVPLCFAALFAMLFVPVCRRLENAGIGRALSTLICVLIFLAIVAGIVALITWQVTDLTKDLGNVQQKGREMLEQVKNYISQTIGIAHEQQDKIIEEQSKNANGAIAGAGSYLLSFLVDFILMIVYMFLFIHARGKLKNFVLMLVPKKEVPNAEHALTGIQKVTQQYLTGLSLMIVCLWILYSIGFSIVGLKNAFFFAVLCGLLETVPFVGNLTGNALAILMALTQDGGSGMVIGILIVYATIQFFQTYLLEPLVVGAEVNISPMFTIIALVIGELVWGIPGMVLAIPLLGIVKIICDHVEPLQPYGYLIGSTRMKRKGLFSKKK